MVVTLIGVYKLVFVTVWGCKLMVVTQCGDKN
jgi:hypothetical protein